MPTIAQRVTEILWAIKDWTDKADWRSWIVHALIGLPIGLVFGTLGVAAAYTIRELEQLAFEYMMRDDTNEPIKWLDHVMDIVAPVLVAWVVYR